MNNIDVLCLEWPKNERDVFGVAPIILELRNHKYTCITGDIFNYYDFLKKYRPRILLMTSFQGARINHNVCLLADSLGIKVVTLIAEGNTRESGIEEMTWGNNKERLMYFERMLLWSKRSEKLMHKYFPQLKNKTKVVGAVGFDRYKRLAFKNKKAFIEELGFPQYRAVVGLAGWGFEAVFDTDFFRLHRDSILKSNTDSDFETHRNNFRQIQTDYLKLCEENKDVLFIVRPHPGLVDYNYDEFALMKDCENVYYSEPRKCAYSISDLISVSDIWGGYETTTCLEAWLLNKESFLYNPCGSDFSRDVTADGSFIIKDFRILDQLIKTLSPSSCLSKDLLLGIKMRRASVISDVIGWDDGLNHRRAVNVIEEVLIDSKYPTYNTGSLLKRIGIFNVLKSISRRFYFYRYFFGGRKPDNSQIESMIENFK